MKTPEELKQLVNEKYTEIALQDKVANAASCCGATNVSDEVYNIMTDDYSKVDGYNADADLGLGCGLPTQFAQIQEGDTVIDLGSGAGNDCFIARHETGAQGKVLGIDFSEAMIDKARKNAEKLGLNNVEFRYGDIEKMPVSDNFADVIVSNCVLNLVPNKKNVIGDIYRVLKPGGHFSISDIVLIGEIPESLKKDAEMYAGCVAGAILKEDYMNHIENAGFETVKLQKEKPILIPDDILRNYLNEKEIESYKNGDSGIVSITVYGEKPGGVKTDKKKMALAEVDDCCTPGGGCC